MTDHWVRTAQPRPAAVSGEGMEVRTYRGSPEVAGQAFAADAAAASREGWTVSTQQYASGDFSSAGLWMMAFGVVFGLLGFLFPPFWILAIIAFLIGATSKRPGSLTVTYARPTTVAARDDISSTLSQLADLRDRGAISGQEYDAKKAELLARL